MHEKPKNINLNNMDDQIDLRNIFGILLKEKKLIIYIMSFFSIAGIIYSLILPNIYQSKALLVPVDPSTSISGALGNYRSLAGLAGINLPTNVNSNSDKAIEKFSSLSLFEKNILPKIYLPDLMAFKSWNSETNTNTYDHNIFNKDNNIWEQGKPSSQKSFKKFIKKHLHLSVDRNSGFVTLSIKHQSPYIAQKWAQLLVDEVNNFYRKKDKLESVKAATYLRQQIAMTDYSEIKQVMAELLQEETKKLTLIEANQSYVFDYIDPPAVMEKRAEPNRVMICFIGALLGGIISIISVFIKHNFYRVKVN